MSHNNDKTNGLTDHDAAHIRFRPKEKDQIFCFSCSTDFTSEGISSIINHYGGRPHDRYFSTCMYCRGMIHQYKSKKGMELYHDCFRSRAKLDH